ncbi:hypothetical protein [Aliiglaciecola litoralis]|uniref:Uncharacterized protein n=1 Tax=Aliiglaciecola litoralis TaxID=582857 RepID=A0ABP3WSJ9_9ALTE
MKSIFVALIASSLIQTTAWAQQENQAAQQQQPLKIEDPQLVNSQQPDPNLFRPTDPGVPPTAETAFATESPAVTSTRVNGVIEIEDTIRIKREQPKVLSIVPWQPPRDKASLPSPFAKRIEQDFMPLERDEFTRRVQHFERVAGVEQK